MWVQFLVVPRADALSMFIWAFGSRLPTASYVDPTSVNCVPTSWLMPQVKFEGVAGFGVGAGPGESPKRVRMFSLMGVHVSMRVCIIASSANADESPSTYQ